LPHPDDSLIVLVGKLPAVLISPVRGHALFGDAMHLLRANLHLERLPGVDHGGVQGLIEVGPGHGDVILKSAGHRTPHLVHDSQSGVATAHRIGDDAHGQQVVDLVESALLPLSLEVHGVEALDAAFDFGRDAIFGQSLADGLLDIQQECLEFLAAIGNGLLQVVIGRRLQSI
jgi:hypothetical protein